MTVWPYHPKPRPGEAFSSWLAKVARGNSGKLHCFTRQIWPGQSLWTRDLDKTASDEVIAAIARGTATPLAMARRTHLRRWEGWVFEKLDPNVGTPFLTRVGVYHRTRRAFGQQYCPCCLAEQPDVHRLDWRLSFMVACEMHGVALEDACRSCGSPWVPHALPDPMCAACGADLRSDGRVLTDAEAVPLQRMLMNCREGVRMPPLTTGALDPLLEFKLVYEVLSAVTARSRSDRLRRAVEWRFRLPRFDPVVSKGRLQFDLLRVSDRARLMAYGSRLLRGWPFMFIGLCAEAGVWRAWALRDSLDRAPFAYFDPVSRYLSGSPQAVHAAAASRSA